HRRAADPPAERLEARGHGPRSSIGGQSPEARARLNNGVTRRRPRSSATERRDQMVRDPTRQEQLERTRGVVMTPSRAKRRSLVSSNLDIEDRGVTREVAARADADFEKIFGSET